MSVCSIEFLLLLMFVSAGFFWLPGVRSRQVLLAFCNAGFLYSLVPNAVAWVALGLVIGTGYAITKVLLAHPRRSIFAAYLGLLLAAFLILKQYEFLKIFLPPALFERSVIVVGLSYMLFRQIHVMVDSLQGQIERFSLWTYLNYQLNLFGLLAGPIQRYQEFQQCWSRLEPVLADWYEVYRAYLRVFFGVIKIVVAATACLWIYERLADGLAHGTLTEDLTTAKTVVAFLLLLYLYPAYIYFNFSGYCDIVIGGSSLLGLRMPENFNWPFFSRNMIEYCTRWHRTLGFWIRDYVFIPMYKTIAERWPSQAPSLAFLCYFIALFLAGIWHGSTWNFVIFGLLNGIGVSAAKLWETYLVKRYGRQGLRKYLQSKAIRAIAIGANFHYVCLTILFFPANLNRSVLLLKNIALKTIF